MSLMESISKVNRDLSSLTNGTIESHQLMETRDYQKNAVIPRSDQLLKDTISLTDLSPLNEGSVLGCLHQRFVNDNIYTNAGSTIVAVNPFKSIEELYTVDKVLSYHDQFEDSPHIYKVGYEAYNRLCHGLGKTDQCIIVSGESGSGKTVTAKHLLRYMTTVANSHGETVRRSSQHSLSIEQRILESNPILEAFGNAVTQRNDNSSRFGKFILLQFSSVDIPYRDGQMLGGEIQTYLLEKTRVVHQLPGECNFHVFYQIIKSLSMAQDTYLGDQIQKMGENPFTTLPDSKELSCNRDLTETLDAMDKIGISEMTRNEITRILVGILFLCNVKISALDEDVGKMSKEQDEDILESSVLEVSQTSLDQFADLVGLDSSFIEQVLLHRNIQSGGSKRRSVFVKPVSKREAYSRRDCLAMLLYSRLFEWLVSFINKQIQCSTYDNTIGLLDIYGFEAFNTNSLEQLCINYANEKLQQHYVKHFLNDLQKEYEEECIDWQHVNYTDNQACLDILEGQPSVFGLLNEDVQLNRETNTENLCDRILELSRSNPGYIKRPKNFMKSPGFTIFHYAGHVTYDGADLSTKNRDNIPQELVLMLQKSTNSFVSELFTGFMVEESTGRKRKTVLGKFKASLDSLMSTLHRSHVHYIRCIKPNTCSVPSVFDRKFVHSQLMACGIIETVEISKTGYPIRMPYNMFHQRYGLIIPNSKTPPDSDSEHTGCMNNDTIYEPLDMLYHKQLDLISHQSPRKSNTPKRKLRRRAGLSDGDLTRKCCATVLALQFGKCHDLTKQFGRTKLFLYQHQIDVLERRRFDILSSKAVIVQLAWRRYRFKCRVKQRQTLKHAAIIIQHAWRKYLTYRTSRAVLRIQKAFRMCLARKHFKSMMEKQKTVKEKPKVAQKSWKPILDRKRTSPGASGNTTRRKRSKESNSSTESGSFVSASGSSSTSSFHSVHEDNSSVQWTQSSDDPFVTSTPMVKTRSQKLNTDKNENNDSKENMERQRLRNPKGRPNMSKYSPVKCKRSYNGRIIGKDSTNVSDKGAGEGNHDCGASPTKKMKVSPEFYVGNGILTRRKIPQFPVKFHTRASVLKYAHYMKQEIPGGLSDCLPDEKPNKDKIVYPDVNMVD
ncbi:Unconventional myosin-XIX [Mactra antiquata]